MERGEGKGGRIAKKTEILRENNSFEVASPVKTTNREKTGEEKTPKN